MNENNFIEEFSKVRKYLHIGFLIQISSPFVWFFKKDGGLTNNYHIMMLMILILLLGFWVQGKYRCPNCGHKFDSRIKMRNLNRCLKCGAILQRNSGLI